MDRQSHYTWTLTSGELTDIWFALTKYAEHWQKLAEKARTGEIDYFTEDECQAEAKKYADLYRQINRMKQRY